MSNLDISLLITLVLVLIVSVVGHEIAHGFVAFKFGDDTAKSQNRLSLNPLRHIDLLGTIIVPSLMFYAGGILFGWAKPVPINPYLITKNGGYFGMICVSLAGIVFNALLCILSFISLYANLVPNELVRAIYMLFSINLILAIFNLYPVPPLDGSKALAYILRIFKFDNIANLYQKLNRYGFIILILIIITPASKVIFMPIFSLLELANEILSSR